jgi:hypothetical protein
MPVRLHSPAVSTGLKTRRFFEVDRQSFGEVEASQIEPKPTCSAQLPTSEGSACRGHLQSTYLVASAGCKNSIFGFNPCGGQE